MTSREPVGCRCDCDICDAPCIRSATQEDLLCDACRPECPAWHMSVDFGPSAEEYRRVWELGQKAKAALIREEIRVEPGS